MRFADAAFAVSGTLGEPLARTIKAIRTARLAKKMTVNIRNIHCHFLCQLRYAEKKLSASKCNKRGCKNTMQLFLTF